MSFCHIDKKSVLLYSTPVENLFIQEYMLHAPGDYVKVYLYARMQALYPSIAEEDISRFASNLGMTAEKVAKAFHYWTVRGLAVKNGQDYYFPDVRSAMYEGPPIVREDTLFRSSLANRLYECSDGLDLTKRQNDLMYEVYEYCEYDEEAAVLFLQYCIDHCMNKDKKTLSLRRMESLYTEWRQSEINTAQKAREFLRDAKLRTSEANKVLSHLGIVRAPLTVDQYNLYEKWTTEWGFTLDSILAACSAMTATNNPNFKYLDSVLSSLRQKGVTPTGEAVTADHENKRALNAKIRKCSYAMGIIGIVTDDQRAYYSKWTAELNISEETLVAICGMAKARGITSYEAADSFITELSGMGVTNDASLEAFRTVEQRAQAVFAKAGQGGTPSISQIKLVNDWHARFGADIIGFAAECSRSANKPFSYMAAMLKSWDERGVTTLEGAKKAGASSLKCVRPQKPRDYEEHEYADGELDALFTSATGEEEL